MLSVRCWSRRTSKRAWTTSGASPFTAGTCSYAIGHTLLPDECGGLLAYTYMCALQVVSEPDVEGDPAQGRELQRLPSAADAPATEGSKAVVDAVSLCLDRELKGAMAIIGGTAPPHPAHHG